MRGTAVTFLNNIQHDGASCDYIYPSLDAVAFYMGCAPSTVRKMVGAAPIRKSDVIERTTQYIKAYNIKRRAGRDE